MSKVVVMGHGGYATAMKEISPCWSARWRIFYYIDFNEDDSLDILQGKLDELPRGIEDELLFRVRPCGRLALPHSGAVCVGAPGLGGRRRGQYIGALGAFLQYGAHARGACKACHRRHEGHRHGVPRQRVSHGRGARHSGAFSAGRLCAVDRHVRAADDPLCSSRSICCRLRGRSRSGSFARCSGATRGCSIERLENNRRLKLVFRPAVLSISSKAT